MWPAPNITLLEDTQHQRQDQTKLIWLGNSQNGPEKGASTGYAKRTKDIH